MKIAIAGLGYCGIGYALMLSRHHEVVLAGPLRERIHAINTHRAALGEPGEQEWMDAQPLHLRATPDFAQALAGAQMTIIATPVPATAPGEAPDLSELESQVALALMRAEGPVAIMSPLPLGTTASLSAAHGTDRLVYVPEILRENAARVSCLNPAAIFIGHRGAAGAKVAQILREASDRPDAPILQMGPSEAEALKPLAEGYAALRLGYFNELDSYALIHGLNARQIIDGVSLDPRVGKLANNPCFGVGGYRMPRAVAAMNDLFAKVPSALAQAMSRANETRSAVLSETLSAQAPRVVGIFGAPPASQHDPLHLVLDHLARQGCTLVAHESQTIEQTPQWTRLRNDVEITSNLGSFKQVSDMIIARRASQALADVSDKVFCRDHFTPH